MLGLCMLPQSLSVQMCDDLVDLESPVSLLSSIPSGSYFPFSFSPMGFSESRGGEFDGDPPPHLGLSVSGSFTLCVLSGCRSLYIFPSATEGSFSSEQGTNVRLAESH